jgi:Do/DeqQ family serine protease
MKRIRLSQAHRVYLSTALIALVVSLSVVALGYRGISKQVKLERVVTTSEKPVLYTTDSTGEVVPLDFTETSRKVLDAVVHITSRGSQPYIREYRQLPDLFRDYFEGSPFEEYFRNGPEDQQQDESRPIPRIGTGSGVIINANGYIVTNNHVIAGAEEIEVTLHNNGTYKAEVVGTDPTTDLALLKIDGEGLKSLSMVNSDDVEVGEWVLAIGNPFSLNSTVTAGIVSAKARNININREALAVESFIQTDAAINPGNSGGALVNLNGDLIGINTAIATRTGSYNGYGFAIPSNLVTKVVEDLLEYGNVQRAILGVRIQTLDGRLASEKGIDLVPGVYVALVNEESAAADAGIEAGDIITAVDGKETRNAARLQELIAGYRPGDTVEITLMRNGETRTLEVTLKNTSGSVAVVRKPDLELRKQLGATFETLDRELAEEMGLDGGVRVTELYPGKLRRETQMRQGFVITHVNGERIKTLDRFREVLLESDGGIMLEGRYPDSKKTYYYAFGMDE